MTLASTIIKNQLFKMMLFLCGVGKLLPACEDPERFFREGPTLTTFF